MDRTGFTAPELATQRLTLRRLEKADAGGIFALRSDPDIIKYTWIKQYKSIEEAEDYIERMDKDLAQGESIVWSVRLAEDGTFVGSVSLYNFDGDSKCAEIGYDSLPPFHGKGLMGEAVKAVIGYGFEGIRLNRIVADLRTENIKSVRLLQRNGFNKGRVHTVTEDGNGCEMAVYSLERTDCEHNG